MSAAPRVVCLVPSLTETLLTCGVDVVGRTRYCIHPQEKIQSVAIVGGTKGVDWRKVTALEPDLVVFDREENRKEMADACPCDWHATHVTSVDAVASELLSLNRHLDNSDLAKIASDWQRLANMPNREADWRTLPGLMEPIGQVTSPPARVEYIIWRNPWMAIGPDTFIGSVMVKVGLGGYLPERSERYPTLDDEALCRSDTFYMFSSEPYPFARHMGDLKAMDITGALVDGELYSWFGIRSLRLLHSCLAQTS